MYIPKMFEITDAAEILGFIRSNPFGQLVSSVDGRHYSSHLPFIVSDTKPSLICHLAKKNPQWQEIEGQEVLVTFLGEYDYISPRWYGSPGVPTWNYQAVHVYGKARVITQSEGVAAIVKQLIEVYEPSFEHRFSEQETATFYKAIVGLEVTMSELQCKYKLSQNRPLADQKRIAERLWKNGLYKLSAAMKTVMNSIAK
jgi:transcriptional regulator